MPKLVFLWTDLFVWLVFAMAVVYASRVLRNPNARRTWRRVFVAPTPMASAIVLAIFVVLAMFDSIHFRPRIDASPGKGAQAAVYSGETLSVLDLAFASLREAREKTYSMPLAYRGFSKETVDEGGTMVREFPRLRYGGRQMIDPQREWARDIASRIVTGIVLGLVAGMGVMLIAAGSVASARQEGIAAAWKYMRSAEATTPWRTVSRTVLILGVVIGTVLSLAAGYHVFGTDLTGNDVFYRVVKSIRTAIVMGALTTAATLPFALVLGIVSGYLRGWADDLIQYFYTVLSSIPAVLLIAACVLLIQVFIDKNAQLFETGIERSDLKLLFLCLIIGLTEFATMCRLVRGETLKLRELDYVQASQAFGAGAGKIMARHIMPNVMHIVIITLVLEFSQIVLYEAVLSYVGVGVDPSMSSFGTMLNLARSEMARDPIVWWNLATAFVFMLGLVLALNLFADGVRDAFDPRARTWKPRRIANATRRKNIPLLPLRGRPGLTS
ncbi:MAG: ABC transporter permease [Burkholderiaceae bacterium]